MTIFPTKDEQMSNWLGVEHQSVGSIEMFGAVDSQRIAF